jgi:C-terminal processing protease CtpA/Prc
VTILEVRSFDNRNVVALSKLPALAETLRTAPAFVIDLRGNGGGNYSFAEAFVLALTDAELLRLAEHEVVSVAAAEGRANAVRRQLVRGQVPDHALPHYLRHLGALEASARELRAEGHARIDVARPPLRMRGHAPGPLRGRGVVLVDEGCASACEMAVSLLRQVPGIVVAGRPTRGGMEVGEIAVFRLPRSGLVLQMGTRRFSDPLGEFVETRGFLPSVHLESAGAQAVDDACGLARRTSGGSAVATRAR